MVASITVDSAPDDLARELAQVTLNETGDAFAAFVAQNLPRIRAAARTDDEIVRMIVFGYEQGIAQGSGDCMNDLGALYYMGDLVGQDYAKAAELYRAAMAHGCYQSIVNLGYIYEYGRTGVPDYDQAYRFYALAAALAPSSEAVYKLGDMYARGRGVACDKVTARALYERSLKLADSAAAIAQPAVRIANLLIDPDAASLGIEPDPLRALALFQQAEIGLRLDIADGQTFYQGRLEEAIEGQRRARALLDGAGELEA